MNTHYGFMLFMVYFIVRTTTAIVNNCPDLTCGNQVIKFPFHIKNRQASMCGYAGFELFCSSNNETMIELPRSVKLNVKNIDYRHQTIELFDPQSCLYKHIHNLNLSESHFNYLKHGYNDFVDNHFFNCSLLIRDKMDSYLVPCLSTSTSQIYAIPSYESIDYLPLSFCTKMFNVSLNIKSGFVRNQNYLNLMWSEPNCKHCESKGDRCGWKNTNSNSTSKEVDCFAKNHKGIFYRASYLYSELLLFRFLSLDTNTRVLTQIHNTVFDCSSSIMWLTYLRNYC